ncbi:VOC family protein [Streptomyces sp. 4N124]|uniref:VOC family protein n=1 Tax=Streptomyces sp. 4N124 TaxID=3457420 RepID=UPI003FD16D63
MDAVRVADITSQQMHLDFAVNELATAHRVATEAGASRLRPTGDIHPESQTGSRVHASPAGHPFCLRST